LERLDRLEATVEAGLKVDGLGSVHPVRYREAEAKAEVGMKRLRERFGGRRVEESLYSGSPNPWDMFRNTGGGR
jgi:hypothetical protein